MVNDTTIIVRNRSDKDKTIKNAIYAFSGGSKSIMIKGEGDEISTAVEIAEILKHRMYPGIEIANVSLGSRPYYYNKRKSYKSKRKDKKKKDIISNIEITLSKSI